MNEVESPAVLRCFAEGRKLTRRPENYFAAVSLPLAADTAENYLVFPSEPCVEFFGTHAVAFWVVGKGPRGNYQVLLTGKQDGVEVLQTMTLGLRDLRTHYNNEVETFRFNGSAYEHSK